MKTESAQFYNFKLTDFEIQTSSFNPIYLSEHKIFLSKTPVWQYNILLAAGRKIMAVICFRNRTIMFEKMRDKIKIKFKVYIIYNFNKIQ